MEHTIEFGGSPQDVTVTASGMASVGQLSRMLSQLCEEPAFEAGMRILLDFTHLDMSAIPRMDAAQVSRALAALQDRCAGCSIAVIAHEPLTAALLRAAEFRETVEQVDVWFAITREEALAWLELQTAKRAAAA